MQTANLEQADSQLLVQTTRHSVMIERLKAGEVKKFEKYLRQIDTLVREQLTRKELTTFSRDRLEQFLARVDGKLLDIYKAFGDVVQADLVDIALYESTFEANSLSHAMSIDAVVPTNVARRPRPRRPRPARR